MRCPQFGRGVGSCLNDALQERDEVRDRACVQAPRGHAQLVHLNGKLVT